MIARLQDCKNRKIARLKDEVSDKVPFRKILFHLLLHFPGFFGCNFIEIS